MPTNRSSTPRTVQDLRNLVVQIGRGDSGVSLGGKALAVLSKLVDRPDETAVRNISELSEILGVNPSTLTRLTTRLGFSGFADFQSVFRDNVTHASRNFYTQQAHRLIDTPSTKKNRTEVGVMVNLAEDSVKNINGFLSQLDGDSLSGTAKLLARGRRVRVHGLRQIHSLASFLTYGLGMVRADVSLLDGPGLGIAEGLAQLEKDDVLIAATVSPYTRSVVEVARVASGAGVSVIAITDTRSSPLVPHARHSFFIPHASSFISNSMGAYVVFCEGLLNLVAKELGEKALRALELRESYIGELNIEME